MSYKIVTMRLVIEHSDNNKLWVIMIEDMLGRRQYNSITFQSPDDALGYISDEFKNCSGVDVNINTDLK